MSTISYAYKRFCRKGNPLPTEELVVTLERRIGATFPDDYRQFLLGFNGGYFDDPLISAEGNECPNETLACMYGVGASNSDAELGTPKDLALFDENDPLRILPIGYTGLGGLIIVVVAGKERGTIFLKQAYGDFYYLADGIQPFFDLLRTSATNPDP